MKKIIIHICVLVLLLLPVLVSAQLFDPKKGLVGDICNNGDCTFNNIIDLVRRLMNFVFYVSVPIAALLFAYAGFLFLTAGPNPSQAEKGKTIFTNVAIGFGIMLAAWLIVYTVSTAIIEPGFFGTDLPQIRN